MVGMPRCGVSVVDPAMRESDDGTGRTRRMSSPVGPGEQWM